MLRLEGERRESGPVRGDLPCVARAHLVCADCRHAESSAVRPRAVCTRRGAALEGSLVFSGQPACDHVRPRRGDDRTLAWCSLRATSMRLRFARVRPHLY
jgi:hypothetical protein